MTRGRAGSGPRCGSAAARTAGPRRGRGTGKAREKLARAGTREPERARPGPGAAGTRSRSRPGPAGDSPWRRRRAAARSAPPSWPPRGSRRRPGLGGWRRRRAAAAGPGPGWASGAGGGAGGGARVTARRGGSSAPLRPRRHSRSAERRPRPGCGSRRRRPAHLPRAQPPPGPFPALSHRPPPSWERPAAARLSGAARSSLGKGSASFARCRGGRPASLPGEGKVCPAAGETRAARTGAAFQGIAREFLSQLCRCS